MFSLFWELLFSSPPQDVCNRTTHVSSRKFQDQGKILPEDGASIASSAMIEARLLGVNFSESEITSRATELAAELTKKSTPSPTMKKEAGMRSTGTRIISPSNGLMT